MMTGASLPACGSGSLARYSHQERNALLGTFDQGNESQKDFCTARGINQGTFKGWLQRRAKRSAPGFARIEVASPKHAAVEITLTNGVRVSIDHRGEQRTLIDLIRGVTGC
jgi:hypothetical protein